MIDFSKPETIKYIDTVGDEGHYPYFRYALIATDTRTGKQTWYRSLIALADELCVEPSPIVAELRVTGRFRHIHFQFESDNFYTDADVDKQLVLNPKPYRDPLAPKTKKYVPKGIIQLRTWIITVLETGYTEECDTNFIASNRLSELLGYSVSPSLTRSVGLGEAKYAGNNNYKNIFKVTTRPK